MASDVFTVDSEAFAKASASLQSMQGQTAKIKSNMGQIVNALNLFSKTQSEMSKSNIVDPQAAKSLRELHRSLLEIGVQHKIISGAAGKEVVDYNKLSLIDRARLKLSNLHLDQKKRMVMYQGKLIEMETKSSKLARAGLNVATGAAGKTWNMAKGATHFATSMTGVQLSLLGIIALLLELTNEGNKIGAMSKQITAQWGATSTALGKSSETMSKLRNEYWMSTEAAGNLVTSLSRAGVEEENIKVMAEDVYAVELEQGIAAQEHLAEVQNLSESYGMAMSQASMFLKNARDLTNTIPNLSMEQVSADMMDIVNSTRMYNTDLLGTVSLYNALVRKNVADKLGLGDLPIDLRRNLGKTLTSMTTQLDEGLKAVLGGGDSPAQGIIRFERMGSDKQAEAMLKFVEQNAPGGGGSIEDKEFGIRKVLGMFIQDQTTIAKMAEEMAAGNLTSEKLAKVMEESKAEQEALAMDAKKEAVLRAKMYTNAQSIANGLTDWETKIKRAIKNAILGDADWPEIQRTMNEMLNWLKNEGANLMRELIGVIRTMIEVYKILSGKFGEENEQRKTRARGSSILMEMDKELLSKKSKSMAIQTSGGERGFTSLSVVVNDVLRASMKVGEITDALSQFVPKESLANLANADKRMMLANIMISRLEETGHGKYAAGLSGNAMFSTEFEQLAEAVATGKVKETIDILKGQLKETAQIRQFVTEMSGSFDRAQAGVRMIDMPSMRMR